MAASRGGGGGGSLCATRDRLPVPPHAARGHRARLNVRPAPLGLAGQSARGTVTFPPPFRAPQVGGRRDRRATEPTNQSAERAWGRGLSTHQSKGSFGAPRAAPAPPLGDQRRHGNPRRRSRPFHRGGGARVSDRGVCPGGVAAGQAEPPGARPPGNGGSRRGASWEPLKGAKCPPSSDRDKGQTRTRFKGAAVSR